ncbi:ras-related GTP-binding protein, putative [Bodo saltans]|uniref:Ras-related GTP-binding protein, putative n=1 Tax=Bodo saltans TaxID=75058 RepID=A0A0S4JF89_BODSA|nr:ras-related GTP-binding protein, putative [Bodo saltans]|eukprot:CUG87059.1 ras-related GTP-binding protein, putative [Bodo saltans]
MATATRTTPYTYNSGLDYDVCVKSIIIGDSGVGKSSLLYRFTDQDWNPHYIATIGVDFKVLTFERNGKVVKLQLWDTAGQERFRTITHSYYRGAHGIILVYDVTNMETFENISSWMTDVQKFGVEGAPLVLVANKTDLANKRVVPREAGEQLAEKLQCKYYETSARENLAVDEAFNFIVDTCVNRRLRDVDKSVSRRNKLLLPDRADMNTKQKTSSGPCEC